MLKKIYEALITIKAFGHQDCAGICKNVVIITNLSYFDVTSFLDGYIETWPNAYYNSYNGFDYPVEGTLQAYMRSVDSGDAWDKTKEAGKRRYELLDFLIEKIGEDLNNV